MRKVVVKNRQRLIDIALQEYGSVEGLYFIIVDNKLSYTSAINEGDVLLITKDPINKEVVDFYKQNNYNPLTEYKAVTNLNKSFNRSFNNSFK